MRTRSHVLSQIACRLIFPSSLFIGASLIEAVGRGMTEFDVIARRLRLVLRWWIVAVIRHSVRIVLRTDERLVECGKGEGRRKQERS
jgi:hypothetical protein